MIEIIGPILSAASKAISSAITHASNGETERAERIVARFVAATQVELDADEEEARGLLRNIFKDADQ